MGFQVENRRFIFINQWFRHCTCSIYFQPVLFALPPYRKYSANTLGGTRCKRKTPKPKVERSDTLGILLRRLLSRCKRKSIYKQRWQIALLRLQRVPIKKADFGFSVIKRIRWIVTKEAKEVKEVKEVKDVCSGLINFLTDAKKLLSLTSFARMTILIFTVICHH